ncbi:class I SAM-dependent DNA methyltransferase [Bacillus pretiosus]|uniref:class I SAM-dependent DNA methyltransferase n=1 Tax=Bacillus TaxID=1386 RepID=UPI003D660C17
MSDENVYSEYNFFAGIYDKHWGGFYKGVYPFLKENVLEKFSEKIDILDLCCGTGQLVEQLTSEGHRVTGLDGSREMLKYAKMKSPKGNFILADARFFNIKKRVHVVFSIYDSLNHIMKENELQQVFKNVYESLVENGIFAFDLNMEENFLNKWNATFQIEEENYTLRVTSNYDSDENLGCMHFIIAHKDIVFGNKESEYFINERFYSEDKVYSLLKLVGFKDVSTFSLSGRSIFICTK